MTMLLTLRHHHKLIWSNSVYKNKGPVPLQIIAIGRQKNGFSGFSLNKAPEVLKRVAWTIPVSE